MTAWFFDPLGVVLPVTVLLKMFFQCLCEVGVGGIFNRIIKSVNAGRSICLSSGSFISLNKSTRKQEMQFKRVRLSLSMMMDSQENCGE